MRYQEDPQGHLRHQESPQGDAVMTIDSRRRPLHYQVLRSLGPALPKILGGGRSREQVTPQGSAA
ncbi:hypothetical protein N7478_010271 [Penicillium angulare]|uniref:uncharacterized protein n=1 Tax=Penicillium angulare TaxID=116970 RepID=UPI00253F9C53|nr:uncharacterized protein N7478_010271 [Penicillium angulare]KAJ5267463.1 hypothetical protein N7478_010271 [Penicillium angulare]